MEKTVERISKILILRFLAKFFNFKFGLQQQSYRGQQAFSSSFFRDFQVGDQLIRYTVISALHIGPS